MLAKQIFVVLTIADSRAKVWSVKYIQTLGGLSCCLS